MKHWNTSKFFQFLIIILCCTFVFTDVSAQENDDDDFEVYLSFRHRGIINAVVISYYKDDAFFLPVNEIFSLFQIQAEVEGLVTKGKFGVDQIPYTIDFPNQMITFGGEEYPITQDDFLIKSLDNYIPPKIFSEVFGLFFSVDFNNLSLTLETEKELPIVERAIRNQRRKVATRNRTGIEFHPLSDNRNPKFLDGGFLDYSMSSNTSQTRTAYNINSAIGLQLAGGDLQGSIFGNFSSGNNLLETNSLRWRYVFRNSPVLSSVMLGQTTLDGVTKVPYTGIRLTNEAYEPRRFFDEYEIQGTTFPESEVELYLNNNIVDFQTADELGNYRFLTPLYYGSSQLNLKIFGPTGQNIERSSRIQVPFVFLPKGVLNYTLNAGQLDNSLIGTTDQSTVLQANTTYGLTNWLTSKVGLEYFENQLDGNSKPAFTSTLSSRLLKNYILTLQGVTNGYYRTALNAIYPNSASFNIDYTDFIDNSPIYNNAGNSRQVIGSVFYPIPIKNIPLSIRSSIFSRFRDDISFSTFRLDLNTRLSKINLRLGYSERLLDSFKFFDSENISTLESSATYNISRNPNIPSFLRGTFVRAQAIYSPSDNKFESFEALFSRSLFKKGRIQLSYGRNIKTGFNSFRFNFVIDFGKVRSNSTVSTVGNNYSATQNLRGSVGYDSNYGNFLFTSRDQVGRSGTAIQLFVDNNNNNKFDDGDDTIPEGVVRVGRTGTSSTKKNGILYYTQMQPYYQYNLEMNKGSIRNPMLVPELENFSIITDPNTFKKVEIPFYMSGIIDGGVQRQFDNGLKRGIGGLKLILTSLDRDLVKEIRTYSDGSYYEYELPPGMYEIKVDQSQLEILESKSSPEIIEFEIKAIPEGDFVEGLAFTLVPLDYVEPDPAEIESILLDSTIIAGVQLDPEIIEFEAALTANVSGALRLIIEAQNAFYRREIETAFSYIQQSLDLFETAQGYALQGSLHYFKGDRIKAQKSWQSAVRFDPDIYIPNIETLDERITTDTSTLEK